MSEVFEVAVANETTEAPTEPATLRARHPVIAVGANRR